jgi:hypothetical protein
MIDEYPNQNSEFIRILVLTHSDNNGHTAHCVRPNASHFAKPENVIRNPGETWHRAVL